MRLFSWLCERYSRSSSGEAIGRAVQGLLYCWGCEESRESMDPFDQYPDMGGWRTVDSTWEDAVGFISVWMCDECMDEFDSTMKGCA